MWERFQYYSCGEFIGIIMNARGLGLGGVLFVGKKSHIRGVYGYLYKYVITLAIVIGFVYNSTNGGKG